MKVTRTAVLTQLHRRFLFIATQLDGSAASEMNGLRFTVGLVTGGAVLQKDGARLNPALRAFLDKRPGVGGT